MELIIREAGGLLGELDFYRWLIWAAEAGCLRAETMPDFGKPQGVVLEAGLPDFRGKN
jgi:hypothetical protein